MNFLDPKLTKDKQPYGPWRYKKIIEENYIISKNLSTSYTDVRDKMSISERQQILQLIKEEDERNKEHLKKIKAEREAKRQERQAGGGYSRRG